MREIVVKVLPTLLRRFWHRHCVRDLQQNREECMLLGGIAPEVLVTVNIYVPAHSFLIKILS